MTQRSLYQHFFSGISAAALMMAGTSVAVAQDNVFAPSALPVSSASDAKPVIRLRVTPPRDPNTRPVPKQQETTDGNADHWRLTQAQKEFFESTTARLRDGAGATSSTAEIDFLTEDRSQGFAARTGFAFRDGELNCTVDHGILPVPLGRHLRNNDPRYRNHPARLTRSDEYVYDGSDRKKRVQVDADWNIYGMDSEDTFGHFDTLDGKRLVSPSNRVEIYAPRFSAVRRVDSLQHAARSTQTTQMKRKEGTVLSRASDFSSSTKQNVGVDTNQSMLKAVGFRDQTRGVLTDNVVQILGSRRAFQPYENFDLIKWGSHTNSETARLEAGMLAAVAWQDNLGLQVFGKKIQPIIVNDTVALQQMVTVETDDDNAILRVTKIASQIAARPGEEVEFTIRFDNLSSRKIGNVTIIDNLTNRLQYIQGTAHCSIDAKLVPSTNEEKSLTMRWEIEKPMPAGTGGVIRFKCRVR